MKLDISSYCNRMIDCECGRRHFCPISDVVIETGALDRLAELVSGFGRIFLAADENTWAACGERVREAIADQLAGVLIFRRAGLLVPDERAVAELDEAMGDCAEFVLGIGSGVINDICKYVTYRRGMEYGIIATAPSMDGYASSGAAMIVDGMKVTYTTRPPKIIVADVSVVRNAPMDMIRSGYGDIIGKYSSLNDWRLSHLISGEHFCPAIHDLVLEVTGDIRSLVDRIVRREEEAIEYLTKALVLIGVTLSLLGSTRPGSGSEHHLSHFFEVVGLIHDKPYFLHGTDVAYSTVVTAGMREEITALAQPDFAEDDPAARRAAYERIFGSYADEVQAIQDEAGSYQRELRETYVQKWPEILEILDSCPPAEEVRNMLTDAGYQLEAFEDLYGAEKIRDAMFYGKDLKDRYSVLWLYYELFAAKARGN